MCAMHTFPIKGRPVGVGQPCFVIAEPGSNHNGSLDTALELIDVAADAKADAVKFQTFRAEDHYVRNTPQFSYLREIAPDVSTFELIKRNELPREWHAALRKRAEERGIIFLSTPSDRAAVDELVGQHDMGAIKIASFEAVDLSFIDYCARKGRPMIIATGMCSLGDVEDILATTERAGNQQVILLHCVSLYPTQPEQVNLRAMQTLAAAFDVPVGLSDHTMGIEIPLAAVALGATVIEKHYTLDRRLPGPDHPFAVEPDELKAMVAGIRKVQSALGSPLKRQLPDEAEMARLGRRSVVARVRIAQGTVLTADMLTAKRPGYGIAPKFISLLVGRPARRTIEADEVVTWEMV
jgi:N,N'-diacetyllegionaminate synthase